MDIGMTLPVMEPGLDRDTIRRWATEIDRGPYSTLAAGERIAFPNPELMAVMAACAAWTERVKLATTIIVAPLHDPVMMAKQLATIDVLSGGRLVAGFGLGGRTEDYHAVGANWADRTQADLARRIAIVRRVWAGEKVLPDLIRPIEPKPVQPGGPKLMTGSLGPKAIRAAAQWADGLYGFSFGPDPRDIEQAFETARAAWKEAGRPAPILVTGFWFALGDGARDQVGTHLRRYMNWLDPQAVEATAAHAGFAGTPAELKALMRRIADLGADEVVPSPVTTDPQILARFADAVF
jgi:alkanesulfonate monooxygenase SsuD/methylene tetrahydromethanopterin reductase-like flavin-dependent oxidoreductase (luciferase family)